MEIITVKKKKRERSKIISLNSWDNIVVSNCSSYASKKTIFIVGLYSAVDLYTFG